MMNNQGSAIYCEKCTYQHFDTRTHEMKTKHVVLGSVTPSHTFTIRTKQGWITLTMDHFTIIHECGYFADIVVASPGLKRMDYYEKN